MTPPRPIDRINRRTILAGAFAGAGLPIFGAAEALAQEKAGKDAPIAPKDPIRITKLETLMVQPRWLFLKVHTNAGIVGLGEPVVEGRAETVAAAVREIEPYLVGKDPRQVVHHWQAIYRHAFYRGGPILTSALSGVDMALWDIKGKALGRPIVDLLGGALRDRMRVYSSNMFQFSVEDTVARARAAVDTGHTGVKFGWEPFGQDERQDLRYVEAIRKAIGDDVDFMLDVGHAWDAKTTIRRAGLFEPYRLFWIEEPLHPDDYAGYGKVSSRCVQNIAAGEQESSVAGFERLIDEGDVDVVQIDLTRTGFTQAIEIADMARRRGRKVCNHNFTTDINTAASLHFLCAIENALVMEYCVEPGEISRSMARNPVRIVDGYAHLPSEPGLGVEPRMETIEKFLVK